MKALEYVPEIVEVVNIRDNLDLIYVYLYDEGKYVGRGFTVICEDKKVLHVTKYFFKDDVVLIPEQQLKWRGIVSNLIESYYRGEMP